MGDTCKSGNLSEILANEKVCGALKIE